jgi:hypothetical protein
MYAPAENLPFLDVGMTFTHVQIGTADIDWWRV